MVQQQIKPISDGIEIQVTTDDGTTYTVRFHCPDDGELDICANSDGTFDVKNVQSDGTTNSATIDPSGGSTALGK